MLGPALALGSSLTGGASDFLGGTNSRRIGTAQWIFCTQLVGLMIACGWVAITEGPLPNVATIAAAAGAGVGLMVGIAAFFQAMVVGTISIVAPISATGVVVPIAAGIIGGERPGVADVIGMAAAIAGIVLAARGPRKASSAPAESGLGLALVAALGQGLFFWLMAPASHGGVPWALLITRAIPAVVVAAILGIRRESLRSMLDPHGALIIPFAAVLSCAGVAFYADATRHGGLAIVSVLASLYPVVTVLLAYMLLGERVRTIQRIGIAAVLAGVVLMSAR